MIASRNILMLTIAMAALALAGGAQAEVGKVRVSRQFGLPYLPMIVIEDQRLLRSEERRVGKEC